MAIISNIYIDHTKFCDVIKIFLDLKIFAVVFSKPTHSIDHIYLSVLAYFVQVMASISVL